MKKKLLLTGINGMLGKALAQILSESFDVWGLGRSEVDAGLNYLKVDLANLDSWDGLKNNSFDYVVHAAANVNLKDCEENPWAAERIHVEASKQLAAFFPNAVFVYISTDSVFDGKTGGYKETDKPNPLNVYAKTKLGGEQGVLSIHKKAFIFRVNIYGTHSPSGKSLYEWGYNSLKNNIQISGFSNVIFNPLSVIQVGDIVNAVLSRNDMPFGIYHLGVKNGISKFEFLREIAKINSFDEALISEVLFENKENDIPRPINTVLEVTKLSHYVNLDKYTIGRGMQEIKMNYE